MYWQPGGISPANPSTVAPFTAELITLYKEPASDPLGIEGSTVYD